MTKLRETKTITGNPMERIAITIEGETVARTTAPVAIMIANAEIVTMAIVTTTGTIGTAEITGTEATETEATGTEVAVETKVRALLSMTILTQTRTTVSSIAVTPSSS